MFGNWSLTPSALLLTEYYPWREFCPGPGRSPRWSCEWGRPGGRPATCPGTRRTAGRSHWRRWRQWPAVSCTRPPAVGSQRPPPCSRGGRWGRRRPRCRWGARRWPRRPGRAPSTPAPTSPGGSRAPGRTPHTRIARREGESDAHWECWCWVSPGIWNCKHTESTSSCPLRYSRQISETFCWRVLLSVIIHSENEKISRKILNLAKLVNSVWELCKITWYFSNNNKIQFVRLHNFCLRDRKRCWVSFVFYLFCVRG